MNIEITEEDSDNLAAYASVSIAYRVTEVLDLDAPLNPGRMLALETRPVTPAFVKDYDAYPGNSPLDWPSRFDLTEWGFLAAHAGGQRVGGAAVVLRRPGVDRLEGGDLAVLWDLRITPTYRRRGVGSALLLSAERWARARGSRVLEVETQDTNVPACRFYSRGGFTLGAVNRGAYAELAHEIQLVWYKSLNKRWLLASGPT